MTTTNFVTDWSAPTDGTSDCTPAWANFRAAARGYSDQANLIVPAHTYNFIGADPDFGGGIIMADGIANLLVQASGGTPTFTDSSGTGLGFEPGTLGCYDDNAHSARLQTVLAGSSTVQLITPAQTSLFTVGNYALIAGFDLLGFGFPTHSQFFEYVLISSIDAVHGTITFSAPLANTYKSTWPLYDSGSPSQGDCGGPATLFVLHPGWVAVAEYQGINFSRSSVFVLAQGRSLKFTNCSCNTSLGLTPSTCGTIIFNGGDYSGSSPELDQLVDQMQIINGAVFHDPFAQTSSFNKLIVDSSTVDSLTVTVKDCEITNSTIGTLKCRYNAGEGYLARLYCANSTISAVQVGLLTIPLTGLSITNGVIKISGAGTNSGYTLSWGVPGTVCLLTGNFGDTVGAFTVTGDPTQDASNTYVPTSLTWNSFPANINGFTVHPAPNVNFVNCTGCPDAIDLSNPGAQGKPIYSYSKRTYTGAASGTMLPLGTVGSPTATLSLWGWLMEFNVTNHPPYTGTSPPGLTFNLMSVFGNYPSVRSDFNEQTYNPVMDLTVDGFFSLTNGLIPSPPSATWFTQASHVAASADISGESSSVWPITTVEIVLNQFLPPGTEPSGTLGLASSEW